MKRRKSVSLKTKLPKISRNKMVSGLVLISPIQLFFSSLHITLYTLKCILRIICNQNMNLFKEFA